MNNKDKKILFVVVFLVLFQTIFVAITIINTYLSIYALIMSVFTSFCLLIAYVSNIEGNEEPAKVECPQSSPTYADIQPFGFTKTPTMYDVDKQPDVPRPMPIDLGREEEINRYAAPKDEQNKE